MRYETPKWSALPGGGWRTVVRFGGATQTATIDSGKLEVEDNFGRMDAWCGEYQDEKDAMRAYEARLAGLDSAFSGLKAVM